MIDIQSQLLRHPHLTAQEAQDLSIQASSEDIALCAHEKLKGMIKGDEYTYQCITSKWDSVALRAYNDNFWSLGPKELVKLAYIEHSYGETLTNRAKKEYEKKYSSELKNILLFKEVA